MIYAQNLLARVLEIRRNHIEAVRSAARSERRHVRLGKHTEHCECRRVDTKLRDFVAGEWQASQGIENSYVAWL